MRLASFLSPPRLLLVRPLFPEPGPPWLVVRIIGAGRPPIGIPPSPLADAERPPDDARKRSSLDSLLAVVAN